LAGLFVLIKHVFFLTPISFLERAALVYPDRPAAAAVFAQNIPVICALNSRLDAVPASALLHLCCPRGACTAHEAIMARGGGTDAYYGSDILAAAPDMEETLFVTGLQPVVSTTVIAARATSVSSTCLRVFSTQQRPVSARTARTPGGSELRKCRG